MRRPSLVRSSSGTGIRNPSLCESLSREKKAEDALVFTDEAGDPLGSFRTAWVTAVLKAHGVKPEWRSYRWTAPTPECQEHFRRINLHFHDLRHEYASRLVEKATPLAQVRDLLGHASITTTERYDNQTIANLVLRLPDPSLRWAPACSGLFMCTVSQSVSSAPVTRSVRTGGSWPLLLTAGVQGP
jgi:hypothetical protein